MPITLNDLRNRAVDAAEKYGTLADIAQAAEIAKTVAEERKAAGNPRMERCVLYSDGLVECEASRQEFAPMVDPKCLPI